MICVGLDMGSRYTKAAIMDETGRVRGAVVVRTRPPFEKAAQRALDEAMERAHLTSDDVDYVATTGFARFAVPFRHLQITDLTCAARGASLLFPGTRAVLDIGFQSTRALKVSARGQVTEFKSNDKCAAGAGGFVERSARYLEVSLDDVGKLSTKARDPVSISSVCAVLAESEIINHVSENRDTPDIIKGVHTSLATRALGLMRRIGVEPELTMVGGMALQDGMVQEVERVFGMKINVPDSPQMVAALGAARLGLNRLLVRTSQTGS